MAVSWANETGNADDALRLVGALSLTPALAQGKKELALVTNAAADFWTIANDRQKAADLGIRATHAQAPSMRVEKGATYELDLRATGEFSLQRAE